MTSVTQFSTTSKMGTFAPPAESLDAQHARTSTLARNVMPPGTTSQTLIILDNAKNALSSDAWNALTWILVWIVTNLSAISLPIQISVISVILLDALNVSLTLHVKLVMMVTTYPQIN